MARTAENRIMVLLFVGVLMGALDLAIVGPALPAIQADFDMDSRQLAWLFNLYVLANLVATPLLAKLSDRYGRRSIYVLSLGGFALGSLLLVIAPNVEILLAARAVQGFGAGGIFPVAAAVIGDTFPPEKRGRALGLIGAVFGLAFLVGPVLGGILLRWSWHWLFLINLPIAALLIWQSWKMLPAGSRAAAGRPFDSGGAVLLVFALLGLAVAVTNFDSSQALASFSSVQVWPWLLLFVVLVPMLWRLEKRAADPIIRPGFFSALQIRLTVVIAMGAGTVESGFVFLPALAVSALQLDAPQAAWLLLPSVLAMTIAAPSFGRIMDSVGSRLVIQTGITLVFIGMLIFGQTDMSLSWFIAGGVVAGLGLGSLLGTPFRYIVLNEAAPGERASAQGLLTVFTAVGQLLGAAIVGGVAASRGGGEAGYQAAFTVLAWVTGSLFFLSLGLKSRATELAEAATSSEA